MATVLSGTATKFRLVFSTPVNGLEACKAAVFAAGAGRYPGGKYTECCWTVLGTGQFRPGDAANPHIGVVGKLEYTEEVRVEVMCFGEGIARMAVAALKRFVFALKFIPSSGELVRRGFLILLCWSDELSAHPYEEPSYGVYALVDF